MPYDLPIQVIWEDRRPSAYRVIGFAPLLCTKNGTHLLISVFAFFFFWYALHENVANRSLSILCVLKYP